MPSPHADLWAGVPIPGKSQLRWDLGGSARRVLVVTDVEMLHPTAARTRWYVEAETPLWCLQVL